MVMMVMIWKSKPPQRWWLHRRGLHWSHRTVEETELPGSLRWGKHKSSFLGNWPCWWWRAWGRSCWSGGWRWRCCQRPCCPPGLPPSPSTQSWRQSLVRGETGGTSWPPPPCPWRAGRWGSGAWRWGRGPSRQAPRCRGRRVFANWQTCRPFFWWLLMRKREIISDQSWEEDAKGCHQLLETCQGSPQARLNCLNGVSRGRVAKRSNCQAGADLKLFLGVLSQIEKFPPKYKNWSVLIFKCWTGANYL